MTGMSHDDRYKYERIADDVDHLIACGAFKPGDRIPSVREMSRQRDVSISTVLQAYYLLEARGLIRARPRSGFYVRNDLPSDLPEPGISSPDSDPAQVSMRELISMVVHTDTQEPDLVQLGAAHPNPSLTATQELNRTMASVARRMGDASGLYDYPPGCDELRLRIARRSLTSGCSLSPDEIIITSGCSESVSLCLRAVCEPGDVVAIESPICFDGLQTLEAIGLQALEIPTHPRDGISLDALRFAIDHNDVSTCMVISNFNNPLGSCIPDENKRELVNLLTEHEIPLIENDIFGELYFGESRPSVAKAYDRAGLVMLCSSFSKSLCPAYRVGWVVPGRYYETVEWLKYTSSLAAPTLSEHAIAEFMSSGSYAPYLRRTRRAYERNVAAMSQAVRRFFPEDTKLTRPSGGFVLWVQLARSVDSLVLYKHSLEAGIAITPGYLFSATDQYRNFIRLNAANWSDEAEKAIGHLGKLIARLA
ncbi:MAG: PLP-dependent aminotransferase family protein [Anaerolineae bacterium]|nr:PLP-dependent aminotransferase family protein [Anaerolineae bacterium]